MQKFGKAENRLGSYLKGRRAKLDPSALGFGLGRRRTPGLRREEVALRANISPTWYTWLEQGRGGPPSPDVLERLAGALILTEVEREHLFLIGLGRSPDVHHQTRNDITPRLQRVLDSMRTNPAFIRTATWDIVAWNHAATMILTDYGSLPQNQRNILRFIFLDHRIRSAQNDWPSVARFAVAAFRGDTARAGVSEEAQPLIDELCRLSPEFKSYWHENDVRSFGDGVKYLQHPTVGPLALEYSAFAVDGRPDLTMVVYNPSTHEDFDKIFSLFSGTDRPKRPG